MKFTKFVQFTKLDERTREVFGVVTSEREDKGGEHCDYASTKPLYRAWSAEFEKLNEGESKGVIHEMHNTSAAVGVIKEFVFRDSEKQILVRAQIVNDIAWKKCRAGVYTGFSHAGTRVKTWTDGSGKEWYTLRPDEISLADNPANPEAHFEYVKADGSVQLRKSNSERRTMPVVLKRIGNKLIGVEDPNAKPRPRARARSAVELQKGHLARLLRVNVDRELAKAQTAKLADKVNCDKCHSDLIHREWFKPREDENGNTPQPYMKYRCITCGFAWTDPENADKLAKTEDWAGVETVDRTADSDSAAERGELNATAPSNRNRDAMERHIAVAQAPAPSEEKHLQTLFALDGDRLRRSPDLARERRS